jgi:hypothetical protein
MFFINFFTASLVPLQRPHTVINSWVILECNAYHVLVLAAATLFLVYGFLPLYYCVVHYVGKEFGLIPVVLEAALLFLDYVHLALFACCVQYVANDAGLKLWNASAVLATVHPRVLLHADQLFPRHVTEPLFVYFSRLMLPSFPLFDFHDVVDDIVLRAYDDQCLAFCEALCVKAL